MSNYDINIIKENLRHVTSGNIIRLICDFIIPNIDKIRNFSNKETYSRNDIVYMYDSSNNKHQLFICNKDMITPGTFNPIDWDIYTFKLQRSAILLESEYVANTDGITTVPINLPLFDADNDAIIVFHSVRGKLSKGTEWRLTSDGLSINLIGMSLYQNEKISFEVFK